MVPGERIELPTFGLQNRCSTAELTRPAHAAQILRTGSECNPQPIATEMLPNGSRKVLRPFRKERRLQRALRPVVGPCRQVPINRQGNCWVDVAQPSRREVASTSRWAPINWFARTCRRECICPLCSTHT